MHKAGSSLTCMSIFDPVRCAVVSAEGLLIGLPEPLSARRMIRNWMSY